MSLSSSRAAHKAALPSILCLFATASPTLEFLLTRSLSTEGCACPQLQCDSDVFLRRDAYPAGKHLEAEKSPSKSRRQGLCCSQRLLTKRHSSLCLSLSVPTLSVQWGTGPQGHIHVFYCQFNVALKFKKSLTFIWQSESMSSWEPWINLKSVLKLSKVSVEDVQAYDNSFFLLCVNRKTTLLFIKGFLSTKELFQK